MKAGGPPPCVFTTNGITKILQCEYHDIESVNINGIRISPRKFGFCQWRYQSPESPVSLSGFRFFFFRWGRTGWGVVFHIPLYVSSADREAGGRLPEVFDHAQPMNVSNSLLVIKYSWLENLGKSWKISYLWIIVSFKLRVSGLPGHVRSPGGSGIRTGIWDN